VSTAVAGVVITLWPRRSEAIPAFARAFRVPCSSCHVAIPRRNEFGDVFRRNGLHWPGREEPEKSIDGDTGPIPMIGVSAIDSVLPAHVPISAVGTLSASVNVDSDESVEMFAVGVPSLRFLLGGELGQHISFFGSTTIRDPPDELYLQFNRLFGRPELNVRAGLLEQRTTMFKVNESLLTNFIIGSATITGHNVSTSRLGVEVNGVVFDRGFLAVGTVQNGALGTPFDGYYHVGVKAGGMNFLGEEPDIDLDAEASVLEQLSLTLGHWGYFGRIGNPDSDEILADIRRLGLDGKLRIADFRLNGGVMFGIDRDDVLHLDNMSLTWFVEASYAARSWLMPVYIYQYQDASALDEQRQTHGIGLIGLVAENLRARLSFNVSDDDVVNESGQLQLMLGI
jgi:hypothetical protein